MSLFRAVSIVILSALLAVSFSLPAVVASSGSAQSPAQYHNAVHFFFAGVSKSSGDFAVVIGKTTFTGGAHGTVVVLDSTGANGFRLKLVSFSGVNSVCSQTALNVEGIVTETIGNGLRALLHQSVAVLLPCNGPRSITIIAPSCVAGMPKCNLAPLFYESFSGTLKFRHL